MTSLRCYIHNNETFYLVSPKNIGDEPLEGERKTIVFDGEKWVTKEEWEQMQND